MYVFLTVTTNTSEETRKRICEALEKLVATWESELAECMERGFLKCVLDRAKYLKFVEPLIEACRRG